LCLLPSFVCTLSLSCSLHSIVNCRVLKPHNIAHFFLLSLPAKPSQGGSGAALTSALDLYQRWRRCTWWSRRWRTYWRIVRHCSACTCAVCVIVCPKFHFGFVLGQEYHEYGHDDFTLILQACSYSIATTDHCLWGTPLLHSQWPSVRFLIGPSVMAAASIAIGMSRSSSRNRAHSPQIQIRGSV
jgi:hypothetical protein